MRVLADGPAESLVTIYAEEVYIERRIEILSRVCISKTDHHYHKAQIRSGNIVKETVPCEWSIYSNLGISEHSADQGARSIQCGERSEGRDVLK